jgi:hypothetical protein
MSAPYYYILVARGIRELPGSAMRAGLVTAIVAYSALALVDRRHLNPGVEDVRDAEVFLSKAYQRKTATSFTTD